MLLIVYQLILLFHTSVPVPNKIFNHEDAKHPYYVSVTELMHNKAEKTIEISCKIFTNDLETILRQNTKGYVDILHPKDKAATEKLIRDYIAKHLTINIDGKILQPEYLGYEIEEEATWSYLQIKNVPAVKKITLNNSILYDYKKEEINMMHVSVNGERKSTKVTNPESLASFEF